MTGCRANTTPAVAVTEGWVCIASLRAAPTTSRSVPRLELVEMLTRLEVPPKVRLPLANGVPAVGRTRTFCQVNLQVTPMALDAVTVNTSCVLVTDVIATAVP